jgi:hypothetical protein
MSAWVDDVDETHEQCVAAGLEVTFPPTDMLWNVREMHLRHPDGHVFRSAGDSRPKSGKPKLSMSSMAIFNNNHWHVALLPRQRRCLPELELRKNH